MQVKKQQLETDIEQWTGSKLGKEYIKAVYCYPAFLTYMQSTSWEMPGDAGSIPESGRPPEEEMATHSSILAWKSHGQRSLVGYSPWGRQESDKLESRLPKEISTASDKQMIPP